MHIGSYRAIRTSGRWGHRYNLKMVPGEGIEPSNQAMNPDYIDQTLDAL